MLSDDQWLVYMKKFLDHHVKDNINCGSFMFFPSKHNSNYIPLGPTRGENSKCHRKLERNLEKNDACMLSY
jgi:hypothetical protein